MAALVVASCLGRATLFVWGRSLKWWVASPWLYVIAIGAPTALPVLIVLMNHVLGAPLPTVDQLGAWPEVPVLPGDAVHGRARRGSRMDRVRGPGPAASARPVGAFTVLAILRILWHLPLMMTGQMPLVIGYSASCAFS